MDSSNEDQQNTAAPVQSWENGDTPAADVETLLARLGPTPIAIKDLQPDELEGLRDFMTDFKFDWEEAASEKLAESRRRRKSSRKHTLCDVTPARRTRPLSGKVLSEDFSDLTSFISFTSVGEHVSTSSGHCSDPSETILDIPPCSLDNSPQVCQGAGVSSHGTVSEVGDNKASVIVPSSSSSPPLLDSGKKRNARRKRRQSSALDRKRDTLALLKTILSPKSGGIALTPPYELVRGTPDRGKGPVSSDVRPAEERKKHSRALQVTREKKEASRRKSRRLSGITGPMLELDTDGVPKLLKLEEVYGPQDGSNDADDISSTREEAKPTIPQGISSGEISNISPSTLMETDEAACEAISGVTDGQRASLDFRVTCQSPMTPFDVTNLSTPGDSEYGTPRGLPVYQESPHTLHTPDKGVLGSFQQMRLHHERAEHSIIEANFNSKAHSEQAPVSLIEGEVGESPHRNTEVRAWESPMMTPDTTSEEFVTPVQELQDGEDGDLVVMEEDNSIGSQDSNKENLSCFDSPSDDDSFVENCDKKVKDLYLKKGQVGPKRGNTNLETVFEDPAKYAIALSRRKFKRLLAFPEKPWEARKGTRGRKVKRRVGKRRKYSLSKTAKKNDPILQERLNFILKDIAEDSC